MTVNGKTYSVEVEGASTSVRPAALAAPAAARVTPAPAPVVVAVPAVTRRSAPAAGGNDVRAPMPGVILDVAVKPGDRVTSGQQLCALEAMKMKNAIRTSKDWRDRQRRGHQWAKSCPWRRARPVCVRLIMEISQLAILLEAIGQLTWQNVVMMIVGGVLIYLAIAKDYEPILLLPIGFGAILANLPLTGIVRRAVS